MRHAFYRQIEATVRQIRDDGFEKRERLIATPQGVLLRLESGSEVINFCANNYLGLADDGRLIAAAKRGLDEYGFGTASVRFICGTQTIHRDLEAAISAFLGLEDTILYGSCFDANGGLFETLLGEDDAVISDALNHASIIDGVRLCKARRFRYRHADMPDLEAQLQLADAEGARCKWIATDGVFSMDGTIADLKGICTLADKYQALVMVDDSHAVGVIGANGRGSPEFCGVADRVDIVTGTLGKALGGASGGYTAARKPVVDLLRQRSRPYLFSNSLAPPIVAASLAAFQLLCSNEGTELRQRLHANAAHFRREMGALGFDLLPGCHPIVPIMLGDATLASRLADGLLEEGIYVVGFSFPVVPKGRARIRVQLSAAHTEEQIARAVAAFATVGRRLGVIK